MAKTPRKNSTAGKQSNRTGRKQAGPDGMQRLQKVLAASGLGSRRGCEELIQQGRVEVDRKVVTLLGTKVDPQAQEIRVDGNLIRAPRSRYYLVNKPAGVLATNADPQGRSRVIDIVGGEERLFTVGRLDRMSEGLILLTNDGELANRLAHPRYGVAKTYRVRVAGNPSRESLKQVREGVYLSDGLARVDALRVKRRFKDSTDMEMVLSEGRNREIRRVLARVGHKVLTLRRTGFGPLRLGRLATGGYRELTSAEVKQLKKLSARAGAKPRPASFRKPRAAEAVSGESGRGPSRAYSARTSRRARPGERKKGGTSGGRRKRRS